MATKKEKKEKDPNGATEVRTVTAEVLKFAKKGFVLPKNGEITVDGKKLKLTKSAVASLRDVKEDAGDKEGAEACRAWLKAKGNRKGSSEPIKEGSKKEYPATWVRLKKDSDGFRNATIPVGILFPEGEKLKEGKVAVAYKKDQIIITRAAEDKKAT
jgi:hypothetical protein